MHISINFDTAEALTDSQAQALSLLLGLSGPSVAPPSASDTEQVPEAPKPAKKATAAKKKPEAEPEGLDSDLLNEAIDVATKTLKSGPDGKAAIKQILADMGVARVTSLKTNDQINDFLTRVTKAGN